VEVVVEATGNPAALELALQIAAKGGRIALVSIYYERTDIEPNTIVFKERRCWAPSNTGGSISRTPCSSSPAGGFGPNR
jgi:threonine dehydrogenase-like Zn-dependent dehydrogenase